MKHLQPYESFEGTKLPESVTKMSELEYCRVFNSGKADFSTEEKATLAALCKLIGFYKWINPTNKMFFTVVKELTGRTYTKPISIFGVTKTGEHTLCTYSGYGFYKDSYYTAPSLEPLLQVAIGDMKAQPKIEWIKIR